MMGIGRTAKRTGSGDSLVQPLRKISPAPALSGVQHTLARLACLRKVHRCFALVKLLGASPLWFGVIPKPVIWAPAHCFRFLSAPPPLSSCPAPPAGSPHPQTCIILSVKSCWVMPIFPGRSPSQGLWIFNEETSGLLTVVITYRGRSADPVTQMHVTILYQ